MQGGGSVESKTPFSCSRGGSIVQGTADLYALAPTEATYSIIAEIPAAFPCTFTGLSSALYPTCQDGEPTMSILLHLEE